jgi:hypothetical protein
VGRPQSVVAWRWACSAIQARQQVGSSSASGLLRRAEACGWIIGRSLVVGKFAC